MKLYAFHTPEIAKHAGYLKIGETHGNVETRVKQQGHEHNVKNEIVWSDVVISDRIGIDKIIHRYFKEQGFHVQQFDATGKDTEWVKCTVGDIIKAFAVIKQRLYDEEKQREEVGHQFYLEIRNWFYWVTQENERIDGDYALRLVVRLLFCFFLREKNELVPKELLDSNILKNLKSNEEYSYSNGILRNLFFHCLNTPQGGRKYENEKLLIDKKTIKEWFSTIPFLNGGLFNELDKDDIPVGNDYFFSEKKVRLLTELGEKCDVYGLITILSKYKYKLSLDDLLDQAEYSETVDPEFIGKVFESLLSCIDADSKENRRKVTGSFYTPREIVDYMVNEALDAYLENHNDILQCKILDPACGSGAFPCEAMNIIMHRIEEDQKEKENKGLSSSERYRTKLKIIRDVIYGVDIQPMAVQITLLRFFLSLIQDIVPDKRKANYGIEPLPNLETKFVCANTLIGLQKRNGQGLLESRLVRETTKQLRETRRQHFMASHAYEKQRLREYDETLRKTLVMAMEEAFTDEATEKLAEWNPYDQFHSASFFDPMWMFGIQDGFDIVIGNPPYISHDRIRNSSDLRKEYHDLWTPFSDLFCYFFGQGMRILRNDGVLAFITSNSFIKAEYGVLLRSLLGKNKIRTLLNIESTQVFSSAIVNAAITIVSKGSHRKNTGTVVTNSGWMSGTLKKYIQEKSFILPATRFSQNRWVLEKESIQFILDKIQSYGTPLDALGAKIRLGIATGDNKAFILTEEQRKSFISQNKKNAVMIKPILRGRNIQRYFFEKPTEYVILSKNGINLPSHYPDLADHLDSFGEKFKNRGAKGQYWWNLRPCDFYDDFSKEKIIWIELSDKGRFALCQEEIYLINSAYFMLTPANLNNRFLLGMLNSKLTEFFVKRYAETSGMGTTRWINNIVSKIPVPNISYAGQKPIITLVDKILSAKQTNPQADTSGLERKIDKLVYALYGLTDAEIALVEGQS